jgi:hypothetical protein
VKTLRIGIPPGIGDAVWALCKVESILAKESAQTAEIFIVDRGVRRAHEFVRSFDFVEAVYHMDFEMLNPVNDTAVLPDMTYDYVLTCQRLGGLDWWLMPNWELEHGVRLEDWLPQYQIDWKIADHFRFSETSRETWAHTVQESGGAYGVFYLGPESGNTVAGHNRGPLWRMEDWRELARLVYRQLGLPIVVVGAEYDKSYADQVLASETLNDILILDRVGQWDIHETFRVCQGAKFVVSYQSGIGIFSTYMRIPVAMWWRPHGDSILPDRNLSFNEKMATAWVPPDILQAGGYAGLIYGSCDARSVFSQLETWV